MNLGKASAVVDQLDEWGVGAAVIPRGQFRAGVRIDLPDGREARWDGEGTASLEAIVLRDGVLVGFVSAVAGGAELNSEMTAWTIARADYDNVDCGSRAATRLHIPPPEPTRPVRRRIDDLGDRLAALLTTLHPRTPYAPRG